VPNCVSHRRFCPLETSVPPLPYSTIRNLFLACFQILIGSVNGRWVRTMSCIAEEQDRIQIDAIFAALSSSGQHSRRRFRQN
jgi:hypothetical protein